MMCPSMTLTLMNKRKIMERGIRLTVHHVVIHVQDHEGRIGHNAAQLAREEGAEVLRGIDMDGIVQSIKHLRMIVS